jgi:hypothetical protein
MFQQILTLRQDLEENINDAFDIGQLTPRKFEIGRVGLEVEIEVNAAKMRSRLEEFVPHPV